MPLVKDFIVSLLQPNVEAIPASAPRDAALISNPFDSFNSCIVPAIPT